MQMTERRWRLLLALCLGALHGSAAQAQRVAHVEVERFVPATSSDGFLGIDPTRTPGPWRFSLGLMGGLEMRPVALDETFGSRLAPVPVNATASGPLLHGIDLRTTSFFTGEVGIGGRAALAAVLIAYPSQQVVGATLASSGAVDPVNDGGFQLGDARLQGRYRLLGPSSAKPDAPKDGPGLAIAAKALLPSGGGKWFVTENAVRSELLLLGDFHLLGAGIGGSLGWLHRFDTARIEPAASSGSVPRLFRFYDELSFGAALKSPVPPLPWLMLVFETRGATDFRSAKTTSIELDLGARAQLADWTLTLGGGVGVTRGYGTPDGRLLLGVSWAAPLRDADGDGIPDAQDQCPLLAEDKDGFQDQDGCPDPDNDNDLVPDVDDLCPTTAAEEGKDENEDGCTDGTKPQR